MNKQSFTLLAVLLIGLLAACGGSTAATADAPAEESASEAEAAVEADTGSDEVAEIADQLVGVSTGIGSASQCEVTSTCSGSGPVRIGLCGEVNDRDGNLWRVPGPVAGGFTNVDLFNDCTGTGANAGYEAELQTQVIDADGSEVTAYLFGDNYYEFYVNGEFAGRDAVNFTTFNSHVARYQAAYPITYAVLLVDWEEYNGIGLESQGPNYHIGDGGFVAAFSDGALTGSDWVCKAFYIAPLDDAACVSFDAGGNPDSSACPSADQQVACLGSDPEGTCQALHIELPANWMDPDFDDSAWLPAATYTGDQVTNSGAYHDYANTLFFGADFIWTNNLDLDNLVVCRATVAAP